MMWRIWYGSSFNQKFILWSEWYVYMLYIMVAVQAEEIIRS